MKHSRINNETCMVYEKVYLMKRLINVTETSGIIWSLPSDINNVGTARGEHMVQSGVMWPNFFKFLGQI